VAGYGQRPGDVSGHRFHVGGAQRDSTKREGHLDPDTPGEGSSRPHGSDMVFSEAEDLFTRRGDALGVRARVKLTSAVGLGSRTARCVSGRCVKLTGA
jgi:hypothetical protein